MNSKRIPLFLLVALLVTVAAVQAQQPTEIRLLPEAETPKISRHIYGHFAEHLGRCIYDGIYVGEASNIPNIAGVREDIITALKELRIPNLRWPGGCFADTYHWKDGIGPKAERPTIVNTWWGNVTEDNSFGTHDFLNLCELLGAEPYISGNVGSGEVQELADWVQYTNFPGKSPMSDLRRTHGREAPWGVKFWGIGNEAWGCGGNMRAEYYADLYRRYATFMSSQGLEGGIYRIASGASDADYHWTEVLMRDVPHHLLEGVALHHYSVIDWNNKGSSYDFSEKEYFETMKTSWYMDELIREHTAIMDKYDPEGQVDLIVDEWGGWYDVMPETSPGFLFQQNTMRDAVLAGLILNIFNNHAARVKMANLAQVVNVLQAVILTEGPKMLKTPTYHVLKMYREHQDAELIPVQFDSPNYEFEAAELPALSVSASRQASGALFISLVNIHAREALEVDLKMDAFSKSPITGSVLTGKKIQDYNSFENPENLVPASFDHYRWDNGNLRVKLPPFSVVTLLLKKP